MEEIDELELEFVNVQTPALNQTNLNNMINKINEIGEQVNLLQLANNVNGLPIGASLNWYIDKPLPAGFFEAGTTGLSGELYPEAYELFKEENDETGLFDLPSLPLGKVFVPRKENDSDFGEINSTLGEKTVQLKISEMPSHSHALSVGAQLSGNGSNSTHGSNYSSNMGGSFGSYFGISPTGGNEYHNNIQPSYVGILAFKVYNA